MPAEHHTLDDWKAVTSGLRDECKRRPELRAKLDQEVDAVRREFARLTVPVSRATLTTYLHGFGQAEHFYITATTYFAHGDDVWTTIRQAAVVALAEQLGFLSAA